MVWVGGCAPRNDWTTPISTPMARMIQNKWRPQRRAAGASPVMATQARLKKPKALDACPPGKQWPGPPSFRPQAQCDSGYAIPPKACHSHGQLVALTSLRLLMTTRLKVMPMMAVQRSRRLRSRARPRGHSTITHTSR